MNGKEADRHDLRVGGMTVSYAARHLYLGTCFTNTSNMSDVIALHETTDEAAVN